MLQIGINQITISQFKEVVYKNRQVCLAKKAEERLIETREFIHHLMKNNEKVYGLTTGFADLRNQTVQPHQSAQLSKNIILSHDAAIGEPLPDDVVLGAMFIRANSLAQGKSGFTLCGLETLLQMINKKVIPITPSSGSLGASGDLAQLSRIGNAMMGNPLIKVKYNGEIITADLALRQAQIPIFNPQSKEGLALTNGTNFMASMLAIAYLKSCRSVENVLTSTGLLLDSIEAIDSAFSDCIHQARRQQGQILVGQLIQTLRENSSFIDRKNTQNDYCIRCMPQIYGPKIEQMQQAQIVALREINAVTDNPLIFKEDEITSDVSKERIFKFKGKRWSILSGGNFHGEIVSQTADILRICNTKIYLNVERQSSYVMNPMRNNKLPIYLVPSEPGLKSGFMITQYTINSLAQQIAHMANPMSIYNITSGNESEDIVSYGHSSALMLLKQITLIDQANAIFLLICLQAYSIRRKQFIQDHKKKPNKSLQELIFDFSSKILQKHNYTLPLVDDQIFEPLYNIMNDILLNKEFRKIVKFNVFKYQDNKFLIPEQNIIFEKINKKVKL